jgi:hypothetical protein
MSYTELLTPYFLFDIPLNINFQKISPAFSTNRHEFFKGDCLSPFFINQKSLSIVMKQLYFFLFLSFSINPFDALAQELQLDDLTDNKGKVEWQWRVSVGEVTFDKPTTAVFKIKNISSDTLIIESVQAGCHCTVPEYPHQPILPNQTAYIKATYDARSEGQFFKTISVATNFDPNRIVTLAMLGTVKAKHN